MKKIWTTGRRQAGDLDLGQLRKQAKELVKACRAAEPDAVAFVVAQHPNWSSRRAAAVRLSDAQLALARFFGAASWPALVERISDSSIREAASVPLLPVRAMVLFPGHRITLDVGRPQSVRAVDAARIGNGSLAVITQRVARAEAPTPRDLYAIGTLARVVAVTAVSVNPRLLKVRVEGRHRIALGAVTETSGCWLADVRRIDTCDRTPTHDDAWRAASAAVEAARRELGRCSGASELLPLLLPHMGVFPDHVQQVALETEDPRAWIRVLSAALEANP